jgi:hypothetical protein
MSMVENHPITQKRRRSPVLDRHYVTGAAKIGEELGCSAITVRRMVANGRLKVFRTGSHTSPIKAWRSEIERIRRAGQR